MIVIRWAAYVVCLFAAVALIFAPIGVVSMVLAAIVLVTFVVVAWTFGAFRAGTWVEDIDDSHPDALGSLDRRNSAALSSFEGEAKR